MQCIYLYQLHNVFQRCCNINRAFCEQSNTKFFKEGNKRINGVTQYRVAHKKHKDYIPFAVCCLKLLTHIMQNEDDTNVDVPGGQWR
jgi:hypothetical protein